MKEFVKKSCLNHEAFSSLAECGPILNTLCSRPGCSLRDQGHKRRWGKCAPSSEMAGATRGLDSPQVPCCASGRLAAVAVALVLDFLAMLSTGSDFSLKKK